MIASQFNPIWLRLLHFAHSLSPAGFQLFPERSIKLLLCGLPVLIMVNHSLGSHFNGPPRALSLGGISKNGGYPVDLHDSGSVRVGYVVYSCWPPLER